jgi:hypothetical protein
MKIRSTKPHRIIVCIAAMELCLPIELHLKINFNILNRPRLGPGAGLNKGPERKNPSVTVTS